MRLPPLDPGMASAPVRALLDDVDRLFGRSWIITRVMAHTPALLATMITLWERFATSPLSDMDREVIAMEMAVANGCHYCVPAHRFAARQRRLELAPLEAIARGETHSACRPAVVQALVRRLVETRGALDDEFRAFQEQGVTPGQMVETVGEIGHCTITNYMNRLARTPLDDFLEPYRQ